jgi:hypothetical protein
MIRFLQFLFLLTIPLTTLSGASAPTGERAEFTDQQFRDAITSFFQAERQKQGSHFSRLKESFLDDPERIEFGKYWNDTGFNYFIIDRKKMKYEFNYMIGNLGFKIHGDIKPQGVGLSCKEPKEIRFMRMHRG